MLVAFVSPWTQMKYQSNLNSNEAVETKFEQTTDDACAPLDSVLCLFIISQWLSVKRMETIWMKKNAASDDK